MSRLAETQMQELVDEASILKTYVQRAFQYDLETGVTTIMSGKIPKTHYDKPAKAFTIEYTDGSSYTIKTPHPVINGGNYLEITSVDGKSNREIKVVYFRPAEVVESNSDFSIKEVDPVKECLVLKAKDVQSVKVVTEDRDIILKKFK